MWIKLHLEGLQLKQGPALAFELSPCEFAVYIKLHLEEVQLRQGPALAFQLRPFDFAVWTQAAPRDTAAGARPCPGLPCSSCSPSGCSLIHTANSQVVIQC